MDEYIQRLESQVDTLRRQISYCSCFRLKEEPHRVHLWEMRKLIKEYRNEQELYNSTSEPPSPRESNQA